MKKIVIDAGHSEAPKPFSREDEIDLDVARDIVKYLIRKIQEGDNKDYAALVIPDTYKGDKLDLMGKVRFANEIRADLYIAIHCNWSESNKAHGFNIFVDDKETELSKKSKSLASMISAQLQSKGFQYWGTDIDIDTHTNPGNLAVCNYTKMPAILIELGFLSNEKDAAELEKQETHEKIAQAIYQGIKNYYL